MKPTFKDSFSFEDMCHRLKNKENFTFSRIASDGELNAIHGKRGSNCDNHPYNPEMGAKLKKIIEGRQRYILGLQSLAYSQRGDYINSLKDINWCNADILHHASRDGVFKDKFVESVKGRKIVLVAPKSLIKLCSDGFFNENKTSHICIPEVNCYSKFTETLIDLKNCIEKDDVIIYCASMMTKILIDRVYDEFEDTVTQIDAGSVFSPYVGISNRGYHKKILDRINS